MKVKEKSEKAGLTLNIQQPKIWSHHFMADRQGKHGNSGRLYFLGLQSHSGQWLPPWNSKTFSPWKKTYDRPRQCINKQRHHFPDKCPNSQNCSLSSSHVQMWELGPKKGRTSKNWCFWPVVVEKTAESPLNSNVIKPGSLKGNQPWIVIGRTDVETEALILWPPDMKRQPIRKDPDAGKDRKQEEKGTTEDQMVGWHTCDPMDMSLSKVWEMVKHRESWHATVHGVATSWTWLSDWTTILVFYNSPVITCFPIIIEIIWRGH